MQRNLPSGGQTTVAANSKSQQPQIFWKNYHQEEGRQEIKVRSHIWQEHQSSLRNSNRSKEQAEGLCQRWWAGNCKEAVKKNSKLLILVEEYVRKIALFNEEIEHTLQDWTFHIHHIKMRYEEEDQRQVLKMRDMREDLLWYKEQLPGTRMPTGQQAPSRDLSSDCKKNATDIWNTVKYTRWKHTEQPVVQQQHPIPTFVNRFELPNVHHEDSEASQASRMVEKIL